VVAPLLPRLLLAAATALPLGAATDFSFEDGALLRSGSRGGRAVVVGRGGASDGPLPAVIFLHGLNDGGPIHRWLNPDAIDLRGVVAAIAESAALPPFILAAPSQTKDAGHARSLWAGFDLEAFVAAVERA
jgi:hypothetical protein